MDTYWRIMALVSLLKELGIPIHLLQTVSSASALGAKMIETNFDEKLMLEILINLIHGGPKVFEEIYELSEDLNSLLDYISKLSDKGISLRDLGNFPNQLEKVGCLLKLTKQPNVLSHDHLYKLINKDLKLDPKKLVHPVTEFQMVTKNETRGRLSIWSARDPEISRDPERYITDILVSTMSLPPLFKPKKIMGELHSDGLTSVLSEFTAQPDRCQTIVLFCSGHFGHIQTEEMVNRQNLLQRLITDFHTDIDMRIVEELEDAHEEGYKIFCDNLDSLVNRIGEPEKIARIPWFLRGRKITREVTRGQNNENLKIILVTSKNPIPGLSLLGFRKETLEKDFMNYGKQNFAETKQFLSEALLA